MFMAKEQQHVEQHLKLYYQIATVCFQIRSLVSSEATNFLRMQQCLSCVRLREFDNSAGFFNEVVLFRLKKRLSHY